MHAIPKKLKYLIHHYQEFKMTIKYKHRIPKPKKATSQPKSHY